MIDETLRLITFSLVVFREATSDVNINGEYTISLYTLYSILLKHKTQIGLTNLNTDHIVTHKFGGKLV